jgi:hypothetical protein
MHAFLIIGTDTEKIDEEVKKITENNNLKQIIPFTLTKLEDSRELKKLTKFSYSTKTCFLIKNIDSATNETLNSILKNLEEPNKNIFYILTAKSLEGVLPTIISRCEVIRIMEEKSITNNKTVNYKDALNIKDREDAISFVNDLIINDYKNNKLKNIESYLTTLKNLNLNGNVSLQLSSLVGRMNLTYGKEQL